MIYLPEELNDYTVPFNETDIQDLRLSIELSNDYNVSMKLFLNEVIDMFVNNYSIVKINSFIKKKHFAITSIYNIFQKLI